MAKSREGGEKNLKILEQALKLRYELAQLHGQPDFANLRVQAAHGADACRRL